jgi:hypothetical protein
MLGDVAEVTQLPNLDAASIRKMHEPMRFYCLRRMDALRRLSSDWWHMVMATWVVTLFL